MNTELIIREFDSCRKMGLNGDGTALDRLQLQFGRQLQLFISRVIRLGQGRGHLADFVLTEARRIREQRLELSREALVEQVVDRVCRVLSGVGTASRLETLVMHREATISAV